MTSKVSRSPRAPVIAGVLATAMLSVASLGVPAQSASPAGSAASSASATVAERTVLQSEFGKARSRVRGTFGNGGTVTGSFTPRRFIVREGQLQAIGTLRATLTRANGQLVGTTTERVVLPVRKAEGAPMAARQARCDILNLVLGPLDLNLLGLEIHLSRVVLDIVAVPGPGNLLGNLLCAIAGLLDNTGVLAEIRRILNAILAILRL